MSENVHKRFVVVHKEGDVFSGTRSVIADRETGVCYLYVKDGYGSAITPLLDATGKPVTTYISPEKR